MAKGKHCTRFTSERKGKFYKALAEGASVGKAAQLAGVSRQTAYDNRHSDAEFAIKWDRAIEDGSDSLEDEAIRRGTKGTLRPIFQGGKEVGRVREYSDTLLIFMLKGRRPKKFAEFSSGESSASQLSELVREMREEHHKRSGQ